MKILYSLLAVTLLSFSCEGPQKVTTKSLEGTIWIGSNFESRLKFTKDYVYEGADNSVDTFQYAVRDSIFYNSDTIYSSANQPILAFIQKGDVVLYYYITGFDEDELDLMSGVTGEAIVYRRERQHPRGSNKQKK